MCKLTEGVTRMLTVMGASHICKKDRKCGECGECGECEECEECGNFLPNFCLIAKAMQRGLGGFPHSLLHQDTEMHPQLSMITVPLFLLKHSAISPQLTADR
ncbi:MAG: hypothetical protein F6K26_27975 [Moorea sp. SIO2I5]|nr:hypothetical protein [Moorena sp. SIO2I5]